MRTLGQNIDEKEVGVMISEVDSDGKFQPEVQFMVTLFNTQISTIFNSRVHLIPGPSAELYKYLGGTNTG